MRERECFSYVVAHDTGYAPNPWGECTLAVCKPAIRRTAEKGDWIIGLTPKSLGFEAVYLMVVGDVMTLGEYYKESRFSYKKPDFKSDDIRKWMGDNFYEMSGNGEYIQYKSAHDIFGREKIILEYKKRLDLDGKNVLVASDYFYFGENSKRLLPQLEFLRVGRYHRNNGVKGILAIEKYAKNLLELPGVNGSPRTLKTEAKKLAYLHSG